MGIALIFTKLVDIYMKVQANELIFILNPCHI